MYNIHFLSKGGEEIAENNACKNRFGALTYQQGEF